MRFIDNDCIKEELLFVDYFECRCTGQDIFKMARFYFDSHQISSNPVVSVSTDGARNMTGRDAGFWGCFKREVPQFSFIHCVLHKQALAAKNLQPELHETLLQGDGTFLQAAIENVTAFQNKLKFFRLRILSNQWNMFPRVEAIFSLSPHLEVKFTPLVEEHLMNLVTDFPSRFSEVPSIPKYLLTPMDVSLEDMIDFDDMLVDELLYQQANEGAKAKYSCV
ncbi:SCAN domain-containing protein 3 [Oopsacas minuta]|uniref:SCAN domain-containing protein 3 n=1 Tax=Oopsacas minuta TaxID=111878 RepID=A0AAV7JQZ3_9METZ|nr:SCAN domain-containing protein 3 [Oopsacas minuta]